MRQLNNDELNVDKTINNRLANIGNATYGNDPKNKGDLNNSIAFYNNEDRTSPNYLPLEKGDKMNYDIHLPPSSLLEYDPNVNNYENPYPLSNNTDIHEMTHKAHGKDATELTPQVNLYSRKMLNNIDEFSVEDFMKKGLGETIGSDNKIKESQWNKPTEVVARTQSLRKILHDEGVYDPFTEDINEDKYAQWKNSLVDKLKKLYDKKSKTKQDIGEIMRIEDINNSLRYMNDNLFTKGKKGDKNVNEKIIYMLNNFVSNYKGEDNNNV